jgi:hypothetical protein
VEQKNSGLGISSFVISLIAGVLLSAIIVLAGIMESSSPGGTDGSSTKAVAMGLFIFTEVYAER